MRGTFSQLTAASSRQDVAGKAPAKVDALEEKKQITTGVHDISSGVPNPVVNGTSGVHDIHGSPTNKAAKKFIVTVKEMTVNKKSVLDGSRPFVVWSLYLSCTHLFHLHQCFLLLGLAYIWQSIHLKFDTIASDLDGEIVKPAL